MAQKVNLNNASREELKHPPTSATIASTRSWRTGRSRAWVNSTVSAASATTRLRTCARTRRLNKAMDDKQKKAVRMARPQGVRPVLEKDPEDSSGGKKDKLKDVQRATRSERERYERRP